MKNVIDLILALAEKDIQVYVENGKLKINAPDGALKEDVIQKIKENKTVLMTYLSVTRTGNQSEIPAVEASSSYVLSSSQRRLWVLSQFEESNTAYNMPGVFVFEGNLDLIALQGSFKNLVARHEILRTVFKEDEQFEIRQYIQSAADVNFEIAYHDLRMEAEQEQKLRAFVQQDAGKPFNLATGPLLRAVLYQVADHKWVFTYTLHHIISDAWSMDILIAELLQLYNARTRNEDVQLPPLRIQYKDYAAWQQAQLSGGVLNEHKAWWLQQFEGELPVLQLAGDNVRPAVKTHRGASVNKSFSPALSSRLQALLKEQGSTLFMGLLAAVNALLYRYTSQTDIVIGTSIASREHPDLESQIGFYVNTLALRAQFKGDDSYTALLQHIKQVTLGAYEHQAYPFDELVNELHLQRDMSRSSLFDVMVVLQNADGGNAKEPQTLGNVQVSSYASGEDTISKFDLTFFFTTSEDALYLQAVYNKDIYSKATITRLCNHLEQLLEAAMDAPEQPIQQLDYLSVTEKQQLLVNFAESTIAYPTNKTIVDLFDEQAARTPENIALTFAGKDLTYRELQEQANKLAAYLRSNCNIKADDLVGIMLDRSASMIIAILGILKSGAAYVAIEPETPRARKEFIIQDTGIKSLITQTDYIFDLDYYKGNTFAIDIQLDGITDVELPVRNDILPADLAYVIYTSGSTGQPKGVMINHQSLVDYVYGILARTNIRECKRFGLVSTIAADLGNTVVYPCLLTGGRLEVFTAADVMNADRMLQAELDCIKIVPSHWKALQQVHQLFVPAKCLIFGGEQLTGDVIDLLRAYDGSCEVYNHYGPSETTIGKLVNKVNINTAAGNVPLGMPFSNSQVYILDAQLKPQPIGVAGEICIGGHGLSRGYLNNTALTAEKFVNNPYRPGERFYRTGDVGKWLADGAITFLGRKDDQVKIRGYRIELGEIETALQQHPEIAQAVVLAKANGSGEKELVAYVVGQTTFSKQDLQQFLHKTLPSFMLPAHYVQLEAIPLTPNGKIDRKRLPDPEELGALSDEVYIAPDTSIEKQLVAIWEEVLGKSPVGVQTSFFNLGGNSLKIIKMSQLVSQQLGVSFSIDKFFEYLTIRDIARAVEQEKMIKEAAPVEKETELMIF